MKSFTVLIEVRDLISVEAETADDAMDMARNIFSIFTADNVDVEVVHESEDCEC